MPWYSITQLPRSIGWKPIARVHSLLTSTSDEVTLRVWITGPVGKIAIYSGIADKSTRTQLSIHLLREEDRNAMQQLHAQGRMSTSATVEQIITDKVNVVIREENLDVSKALGLPPFVC